MTTGRCDVPDEAAMRAARRRWAGGVAVVLAPDDGGWRGATVGAFTVVSLDPPLVLVCLDNQGRTTELVADQGRFAVSILERRHEFLAERFAGRAPLPDVRLTGVPHQAAPSGLPVLTGALAWFDCRLRDLHDGGDPRIIVGEVTALRLGDDTDDPLVYYEGRYRAIEAE